jgi:ribulose 1,5-bisphosphate carboxylase large subunit-like protein
MNGKAWRTLFVILIWAGVITGHVWLSPYVMGGLGIVSALIVWELWRMLGIDFSQVKTNYHRHEGNFLALPGDK